MFIVKIVCSEVTHFINVGRTGNYEASRKSLELFNSYSDAQNAINEIKKINGYEECDYEIIDVLSL